MKKIIAFLFVLIVVTASAQKKKITTEDVWRDYTFFPAMFPGFNSMNDGSHYTQTEENGDLTKYELSTGRQVAILVKATELVPEGKTSPIKIDDYSFSDDETKLVIRNEYTPIYRRSGTANNYVFDFKTRKLKALSDK